MYTLKITRCDMNPDRDYVFGDARLYDAKGNQVYKCVSLERYSMMISAGEYRVDITFSPKFKRELLHVCDVKGRAGIRIHPFNFAYESKGCIALGEERNVFSLVHSGKACRHVQALIYSDCGECKLVIG